MPALQAGSPIFNPGATDMADLTARLPKLQGRRVYCCLERNHHKHKPAAARDRSEFCVNRIFSTRSVLKIKTLRLCVLARKHYFEQSPPLPSYGLRATKPAARFPDSAKIPPPARSVRAFFLCAHRPPEAAPRREYRQVCDLGNK